MKSKNGTMINVDVNAKDELIGVLGKKFSCGIL